MNTQIELKLPAGIKHSARDVILPEGMSQEAWLDYGRFCRTARQALVFWESRWLSYGRKNFGNEAVREAASQLSLEFRDIKAMEALNTLEIREERLTPEHHFVLSRGRLDGAGQEMWRELAVREHLSAHDLQESIRKGTVTRVQVTAPQPGVRGMATFQGVESLFRILERQIGPLLPEWTAEDARRALEHLARIEEFGRELRARFGIG